MHKIRYIVMALVVHYMQSTRQRRGPNPVCDSLTVMTQYYLSQSQNWCESRTENRPSGFHKPLESGPQCGSGEGPLFGLLLIHIQYIKF